MLDEVLDKSTPIPLYFQLKEIIKDKIDSGKLKPGDILPSERELSQVYQISRPTIRQALKELVNEGLLYREKGKGTYVSKPKINYGFIQKLTTFYDDIKEKGDTLGGIIEIRTTPLPVGLGSHTQWDRKLDGILTSALMSIPAVKGVEIGPAFNNSTIPGSEVHDEIFYDDSIGYYRTTNSAGGIEGGVSNGQALIIRIAMKPIPTLYKPLQSVDIKSKEKFEASVERSDVTAVPACGVVGEAMVSFVIAQALLEKFGGDSIEETISNYQSYIKRAI